MKMQSILWLVTLTLFCLCASAVAEEEIILQRFTTHTIPLVEKAPVIDGTVDAKEWGGALELPPLIHHINGTVDSPRTVGYICYTKDRLFLAWKVFRPENAGPPLTKYTDPGNKPGSVLWKRDDNIQLHLDINRGGKSTVYFAGNAAGAFVDGIATWFLEQSKNWNWNYSARITDFGWEGENSISFNDLGLEKAPEPGTERGLELLSANISPNRYTSLLSYRIFRKTRIKIIR